MGSTSDKGIDFSGGLVWVRQKNGSWWPGKILTPDELPESLIATPKSGTPLMLLGKKGTTVHWFNLEKSKRIKAFHCGEYEDCIEKAKSSSRHSSNKGVRKGRLEDAILKALELESALDHRKVYAEDEEEEEEEHANRATSSSRGSEMDHQVSEPLASHEENGVFPKRMRGLENLGASIPSTLKRKRSSQAAAHELLKRRNRRRPLTKVLESGTVIRSLLEQRPCRNGTPCNKSRRKRDPRYEDSGSSQILFDVPLVSDDKIPTVVCDASRRDRFESSCVGPDEKTECASDWQSKGKRNSRPRKVDAEDESLAKISLDGSKRLLPSRLSRYAVNPKYDDAAAEFPLRHHGQIPSSRLYNVAVEVKSSSRPHHVPYVSLASKANGAPITGHPVAVEVLDHGSSKPTRARSRKSGILSKKTRKLSSFTATGKQQATTVENSKWEPPSVTCIPIRIVFGRINAAFLR